MLKLSAITLLLAIFFATIVQAQQQQPPPPGVEPPPNNGTAGGGAVFDALTPPWTNCVDTPSIDIKFPPGIIDANLADVFRLEPQVRFICGGETKIFYNWTISPPPPRPIFQGPPPAAGPPQPPMGHERALVIPPGLLEGDKVYEVALVAYGRVNNTVTNPWIISNVSAFIRGRRVRPVINILGGDRRSVRRGGIIKASIESQGLQDVFDRYRVHCCKLVDNNDDMSPCSGPCLNVTLPGPGFNPSAEFASRFNRSIHAFNFTELGLYRIEANVSWMENGNDRSVTSRQVVDVFPQDFPFDAVSIVAPRNDLFAGDAGFFFSASVARRNSTDRNRTSRVEWEISGNKGPAINITRPPRNDDFRLRVDPDEVASLNDPAFGQAFLEIKVKVSANAPPMGQLPPPQMNASHRVFIRPSPSAGVMCNVAKSLFDPDFANSTVTGFRSGRSRLNVSIDGLNRTEFQDVTFNVLIDIQSPDGRNYSVSISPGAEANDRAFEDFPLPYIRKNPQGKAVVFVEIGAFGRTFRKTPCGEFSLFAWDSQNAQNLLAQFDRIHRRGRNAIEEKDIRSLHQTVSDFAGILSVVPTNSAQFLNNPNFGTQMGMFLNALAGMVLDQGIDNVAGRARENIISFVFEAVRVFSSRWAGNAYMTTTLPQMLIKLSSSSSEQNVPSLRNIGQDVMEIFNTVGANMPRNLRFRFLQQIIRAFGSKQSNDGPGASDNNPVNLGSSFRADVVTITGANAAANKTFNCSGGDFHVRPSPKQFENIGDEDSVTIAIGRTSSGLFGMSGVLASDIFDINTLVNSATQTVQNLPEDNAFEFRIPCPAQTDCKRISCVSFDDINDRWVEIPTRLAPPLRNGTEVPQAPPSQPGQAPSQPPAGTYLPDILCKTQHLSIFSLTTTSESTSTTTPSPSASAGTVGFFTTVLMIVVSLFLF